MLLKKIVGMFLCAVLVLSSCGSAFAAADTFQGKLEAIELDTYGQEQNGSLMERISRLESDFVGEHNTGSISARIDAIYDLLYENGARPSLLAELNAVEWNINHEVSMTPVDERIAALEMNLEGKSGEGTFRERITALTELAFGSDTIPVEAVNVASDTLIKIALAVPVNAKNLKIGDTVRYKVADDVIVDGLLVFAKGSFGVGKVLKVKQARNFGRNAEVEIDFARTKAADGTFVDTFVGEEAKAEMKNLAMAAGASLAGIAVLGPVGIVAGAFVHGKNIDLPEGTEVYIQTRNAEDLYGVRVH